MLQLYDKNHVKIQGLTKYKDYNIESTLSSGDKVLSFVYPTLDSDNIQEEGYIRTKTAEFVIKSIEGTADWKTIKASLNVEDLEGKPWDRFDSTEQTITDCLNLALAGTGWIIGICNISKKRTVRKTGCSSWDIVQEAIKTYRVEVDFDTLNKVINIYDKIGSDKGAYFIDSLNLKELTTQSNSYSYYTRIQAVGKDGLTLADPGYVENYQYSNKIKTLYWKDERYADVTSLTEDAALKLDEISKPYRAYGADIIDLANCNDKYKNILSYCLGDTITIISMDLKIKEKQRIAKITQYPEEPERNTCELANVILSFEDVQKENQKTTDTVNNITEDDGTVSAGAMSTAVNVLTAQRFSAVEGRVGTLEITTAHITNGIIDNATIDAAKVNDLSSTYATITNLNSVNVRIDNLSADYAHITNGIIDNAKIDIANVDNLSSTYATIESLNATNASIDSLNTNKANVSELTTATGRITTLESTAASIQYMLAGNIGADNLSAGAIQAGSAVIAEGAINSAQIISLKVSQLETGIISTTKFNLQSDSGNLKMLDNTIQISDANRVRVQIGKDTSNDYNMYVWDDSGNLMFDAAGLQASGIKDKIIRDDMISDTANINAEKINIDSMFSEMNNNGVSTLKGSKIYLDTEEQTLQLAFTDLSSIVSDQGTSLSSQGTSIAAIQGQITSKIWSTDITTAIDDIQIGGRNFLRNTSNFTGLTYWALSKGTDQEGILEIATDDIMGNVLHATKPNEVANWWVLENTLCAYFPQKFDITKKYTVSFYAKALNGSELKVRFSDSNGTNFVCDFVIEDITMEWKKYQFTFTPLIEGNQPILYICSYAIDEYWITNIKLEEGTKATDWTPAPEDVDSKITTINDNYSTLNQTVNGISADVSSLQSTTSDLGSRVTTAESNITANASEISLKVTQTEVDTALENAEEYADGLNADMDTRISTAESSITQNAANITSKVSQTEVDNSINAIEVGGRNMINNSTGNLGIANWSNVGVTDFSSVDGEGKNGNNSLKLIGSPDDTTRQFIKQDISNKFEDFNNMPVVTLGFWYKASIDSNITGVGMFIRIANDYSLDNDRCSSTSSCILDNEWHYREVTVDLSEFNNTNVISIVIYIFTYIGTVEYSEIKLEKGTKATDWSPAPEDVQDEIYGVTTSLSDVESRISSAETIIQQNASDILLKASSSDVDTLTGLISSNTTSLGILDGRITSEISTVQSNVNDVNDSVSEIKTYMDFDESGLLLGKSDSPMQIKLDVSDTEDPQLQFLSSGNKVAYMSDDTMLIDKAKILTSIQVGNHLIEKYDSNITLIKWIG